MENPLNQPQEVLDRSSTREGWTVATSLWPPTFPPTHPIPPTSPLITQLPSAAHDPQPNDVQIGGDHYKSKEIQPWDYIAANNLDYFQGNVVKYVTRWRDKGGLADLEKTIHYLQKYIEVERAKGAK